MFIQICTTCFHPLWCYLGVVVFDLGLAGTGFAYSFTNFINVAVTMIFMASIPKLKDASIWPDASSFTGFKEFLSLGIPSMIVLFLE